MTGCVCPSCVLQADVPVRSEAPQYPSSAVPLSWGQRDPVLSYARSIYTINVCVYGRKEFWLENIFFIGKDSTSPKGDGRICQTKPPEENITESVKEIHVQTLASVKHSRILV